MTPTGAATMRRSILCAGALALATCSDNDVVEPTPRQPHLAAAAVAANPDNVLSAMVTVRLGDADSVAVRFAPVGGPLEESTPAFTPAGDSLEIPVLGLLPETEYALQVAAWGGSAAVTSDTLTLATGSLPADLPAYVAAGSDPSPGYVVFAAGLYGIAIDNDGRVVWYHRFPNGPGLNVQPQPTGRYVARPPVAAPDQPSPWVEIDVLGRVTRTLDCADGLRPRFHDIIVEKNGSYWVLCDEVRTMDLSPIGGSPNARVTGTVIQHIDGAGTLLFSWSVFDHFDISTIPEEERAKADVNWTHGNALAIADFGGVYETLFVSFRNLGEITLIHTGDGTLYEHLGGPRNDFYSQDGAPSFAWQHGMRLDDGYNQLVLLDNRGNDYGARVERYALDYDYVWVAQVGSYGSVAGPVALGGSTQPLAGERVLVSYGNVGRVEEYDGAGRVVWSLENPGYVFRATRIRSLYKGW